MQPIFASPAWTRWLNLIGCAGAGGSALDAQILGDGLPRRDRDALRGRLELRVPHLELVRARRHVLEGVAPLGVDGGGVRVLPDEDVAEHLGVDGAELGVRALLLERVRARLVLLEGAEVVALVVGRVDVVGDVVVVQEVDGVTLGDGEDVGDELHPLLIHRCLLLRERPRDRLQVHDGVLEVLRGGRLDLSGDRAARGERGTGGGREAEGEGGEPGGERLVHHG
jgi:hypothetical protein